MGDGSDNPKHQSPQNSVDSTPQSKPKPKPKKQSKSKTKSKKANKTNNASNGNTDYLQLKKQYEGMVKLWNEERANLKKAQQLLRSQKESFKAQQNDLESAHLSKINQITAQFQDQINAKNGTIQSLEASLLSIKEDRNEKIE